MWIGKSVVESTWEPASSLPANLVADFERGIEHELCTHSSTSGVQTIHTLSTVSSKRDDLAPKKAKKAHTCVETFTNGYAMKLRYSYVHVYMCYDYVTLQCF